MARPVTRLAPSPTGALHLGNARTFLINWALARQRGWEIAVRMEDLDSPRVRPEAVRQTLDTLQWLGIDWDGEWLVQSADLAPYHAARDRLIAAGCVFTCPLSRRDIETAASAPHGDDQASVYPRPLRPERSDHGRWIISEDAVNYRFAVPDEPVRIQDEICGVVDIDPVAESGDFVIWTKRGTPAYQLAVVVDDIRQGVSDVVRGNDLLASAGLQTLLYRVLGAEPPRWWHLGLVVGPDGRRLAKRHGDTRIETYRAADVSAERLIGWIAGTCGGRREPMSAREFALSFDLERVPEGPVTFTEEDDSWLRSGTSRSSSSSRPSPG